MKNTSLVPKIFVDTNILVDFFLPERPKHAISRVVFHLIFSHYVEASISTQSLLDAVYICGKSSNFNPEAFRETMLYIVEHTNISYLDFFDVKNGLMDACPDIEDSAQISFAYDQCCDFIITADKELLSRTVPKPMKVMTPEEFVNHCRA